MRACNVVLAAMVILSVFFIPAVAGQKTVNLQGRLTDPTSNYAPITGVHTLYFRLYDTPAGGSPLWTEQHVVNLPGNGVFNVVLGSSSTLDGIPFNKQYYVGIVVDGGGIASQEMSPRQQLQASVYTLGSMGDLNVGRDLYVVGNSSISCSLFVSSNVTVSGNLNLTKDLNVSGKVNMGSPLVISSNAVVAGNTVLQGSATINGSASILSNVSINGNTFIAGKVGIGTNNPYAALDVNGDIYTSVNGRVATNNLNAYGAGKNLQIAHGGNGYGDIVFGTQINTERMRITNSGYVGIGKIPGCALDVAGTCRATTWTSTSDERLKRDIKPLADGGVVNKVAKLQAIKYKFDKSKMMELNKGAEESDANEQLLEIEAKKIGVSVAKLKKKIEDEAYEYCDDEQIGLSAQELEKEFPELVHTDKNGYKAVNYDGLTVILIEVVKKQQSAINDLEQRVKNLESVKK